MSHRDARLRGSTCTSAAPSYPAALSAHRLAARPAPGARARSRRRTGADAAVVRAGERDAVEPVRRCGSSSSSASDRRARGTAEHALTDRFVDAVTVGQAFHWFKSDDALREIHRVLCPGGGVALIWNARDERNDVQAALSDVIDPLEGDTPRRKQREWRGLLAESGLFERCERALFEYEQVVDEQGLVERVVSISFIAAAPQPARDDVEARVRAIARQAEQPIRLPYMTELYLGYASTV